MSTLHRAARAYADRFGWFVFPLAPRGKAPLMSRRDGGRGHLDATADPRSIDHWWTRTPDANIGLACGASGITVLDVDPRSDGDMHLRELLAGRELPETPTVWTGGEDGGSHTYFAGVIRSCSPAPGVDLKSDGGYVVLPPSIHPSGRAYQWEGIARPDEIPLAPLPDWLRSLAGQRKRRTHREHSGNVDPESFALGAAFKAAGLLGEQIRPGVFLALCPNRASHTMGHDWDSSSVVFAPQPGKRRGVFHCRHGHCAEFF